MQASAEVEPDGDHALLSSVSVSMMNLKSKLASNINVHPTSCKRKIHQIQHSGDNTKVDVPARRTMISYDRHAKISEEELAEMWCIGPKRAKATLLAATQRGTRSAILLIGRRYRTDKMYSLKRLQYPLSTDTLYSDEKSLTQNTCGQV